MKRYELRQWPDGTWVIRYNGEPAIASINFDAGHRLWREMWRHHDALLREMKRNK